MCLVVRDHDCPTPVASGTRESEEGGSREESGGAEESSGQADEPSAQADQPPAEEGPDKGEHKEPYATRGWPNVTT